MIRIDEIYSGVFVPAIRQLGADRALHWFDPPGSTSFEDLCTCPAIPASTTRYIFWDQEPVSTDRFDLFMHQYLEPFGRLWNPDIRVITSEYCSDTVDRLCEQWSLQSHYYWFHGWAALDWYRGYNRTGLIPAPADRHVERTFMAPNRIIGGARQHRLHLLYWIFSQGLEQTNCVSCPSVCPAEQEPVESLIEPLTALYPTIEAVFDRVSLPLNMPGEQNHPMTSMYLDLWQPASTSLLYVVTETVADGGRQHLTEKIFKPICLQMPFVAVATSGALAYLRSYGFRTFDTLWDESYDAEPDMARRVAKIGALLGDLDQLTIQQRQELYQQARPIVEHNYRHFYSGAFEQVLWQELNTMLAEF